MRGVHPAKRHNVTLIHRDTLEGAMRRPVRHVVDCTSDLDAAEVDTHRHIASSALMFGNS